VVEFGAWLCEEVLKAVPHRQWVFSIPKILRKFFMTDRLLLCKLSRCAWKVLSLCLTETAGCDDARVGAAVAVHTFGDFQNFNPHLHIIVTDGCFYGNGRFLVCTPPDHKLVEEMFRHEVFKMLKSEGKIGDMLIDNLMNWRHSGFNVYCGDPLWPGDRKGLENLSRYIIRACFSQQRMTYIPGVDWSGSQAKVIYRSKDGSTCKTYDALDWLAQLTCHIPNRGEQMVRYYGHYSNKCRGQRKKSGSDEIVPTITEFTASFASRKSWAQLIQKIYEVDPLICPKCQGRMRVIAFIEDDDVIRKILVHLGLWDTRNHDPPHPAPESFQDCVIDESYSQLPQNDTWMM